MRLRLQKTKHGGYISTFSNNGIDSLVCKEVHASDIDELIKDLTNKGNYTIEELPVSETELFDCWVVEK